MENAVCGQILEDAGIVRTSPNSSRPSRMRLRGGGQGSSSVPSTSTTTLSPWGWSKKKTGRHVTNIQKINAINNFGIDGRDNKLARGGNNASWVILKIIVALLMTVWFGALVWVIRGAILPPSSHDNANNPMREFVRLDVKSKSMDPRTVVALETEAVAAPKKSMTDDSSHVEAKSNDPRAVGLETEAIVEPKRTKMEDSSHVDVQSKDLHTISMDTEAVAAPKNMNTKVTESNSIYDLSLFGNKSPSDFQLYTPHAPSCTDPLDMRDVSYTLVSQLSNDRLWMVPYHCERWGNNPMSIVVLTDRTAFDVKSELISKGCSGESLTLQTVEKTRYDPDGTEYPVNLLRNLAMSAVRTSHVLYADVDFWPSSDLHSILINVTIREELANDSKLAAIVPVFQMQRMCREYRDCREANIPRMPEHKQGLLRLIETKAAYPFDPTNHGGHGSTKYKTWKKQETATFVDLPCIMSNRYEPYLVFRYCSELPPFQEGFTGYGKNKMTWAMQLRMVGYKFSQIGGSFLVHYPHLDSKSRLEWNKKPEVLLKAKQVANDVLEQHADEIDLSRFKRARVDALFLDFKRWLYENVEDDSRTPKCRAAQNDDLTLWVHPSNEEDSVDEGDDDGENVEDGAGTDLLEKKAGAEESEKEEERDYDGENVEDGADADLRDEEGGAEERLENAIEEVGIVGR